MTEPFDEYGEVLRRALRAEADEVMPSMDGLERIRSRTAARRSESGWAAWFAASWTRPLAAVGVAVVLALVAVSAPPAINHITSLTSDQGSAPRHSHSPKGDAQGTDGRTYPVQPGPQGPGQGVPPSFPAPSGFPGDSTPCMTPSGTPDSGSGHHTPTPTRRTDRTRTPSMSACPSATPTTASPSNRPTTAAPSATPTPTGSGDASQAPAGAQPNTK